VDECGTGGEVEGIETLQNALVTSTALNFLSRISSNSPLAL